MKTNRLLCRLTLGLSLALALALLVLVTESVSSTPSPLAPGNPTPHPEPNSHTASPNTAVSITYDEPISPTTVSTQTFAVHAMQTGLLLETYSVHSGTISLTPTHPFQPGELVQVSATTGTLSLIDGQGPISPTVWSFRVIVLGGSGVFTDSGQSLGSSRSHGMAMGDVDGDGDLDAFISNDAQPNRVWLNDGTGVFSDSGQSLGSSYGRGMALGDVNGDGDLDAFVANCCGEASKVWLNDGLGNFSDSGQNLGNMAAANGVALGDVDGDGDLDAFVANGPDGNRVWLNDGTGTFSDSGQSLHPSNSRSVALADVDADGDLDAFTAESDDYANMVWLNDGTGTFIDSGQRLGGSSTGDVALGDLDDDGDLDAFVANGPGNQPNKVWLNDGVGNYTDSGQSLGNESSETVALGDVDGDGDLDAFVANRDNQPNKVWLNDGLGAFSDSGQSLGSLSSLGAALGDMDSDGDLDAFVANGYPDDQPAKVWLNQGEPANVYLIPPAQTGQGARGQVVAYEELLTNATGATDSFSLTLGDHIWDTALSTDSLGPIADGDSATFTVYVTVPTDVDWYSTDTVSVTATSVTSPTVYSDAAIFTTEAYAPPEISVSPDVLTSTQYVNEIVQETLTISNGNGVTLTFELSEFDSGLSRVTACASPSGSDPAFRCGAGAIAYVTLKDSNLVSLVDTATHSEIGTVDVGAAGCYGPWRATMSPDGSNVYVGCRNSGNVAVIETAGNSVVATVEGIDEADGIAFTRDGAYALVGSRFHDQVAVVDTATHSVVTYIYTPSDARSVAAHPFLDLAYATSEEGTIQVIDTTSFSIVASVAVGYDPHDVDISPDGKWVFAGSRWGDGLAVIDADTNTVHTTVTGLGDLTALEVAPDGSEVYACGLGSGVHVIDGVTFDHITTVAMPGDAWQAALTCDGTELYVGSKGSTVPVMDTATHTVIEEIPTSGNGARGIAICPQHAGGDVPWLSMDPVSGTVPINSSVPIQVTFDATGIQPDSYSAQIVAWSNDPMTPAVFVPVAMTVEPTANMGWVEGTVTDAGTGDPLEATIIAFGQPYTITTDPETGYYLVWLDEGSYTLQVTAEGYVTETADVDIVAQQGTTQDFAMVLDVPVLEVSPESLEIIHYVDDVTTQTLTISNAGPAPLDFSIGIGRVPGGAALEFDGTDDQLNMGHSDVLMLSDTDFTVEAWISTTTTNTGWILGKHDPGWGNGYGLMVNHQDCAPDKACFDNAGDHMAAISTSDVNDGQWHHIAGVYNVSGTKRIYIDGTLEDTQPAPVSIPANTAPFRVGYLYDNNCCEQYQGQVDEVRVWDIARTEAEIQSTMHTPLIGLQPDLVGYWKLDEGSGQTAFDSTEYGNDGQLGTSPGADPSDPTWFLISPQGGDVLWLTIDPVAGTVPAYSSVPIQVTFDATGVEPGEYTAEIAVLSNDPVTPWVSIPVTMTVIEPVVADFAGDPTTGVAPLEVTFTNQSTGDYVTCDWDFGDDGTSNVCIDPIHTYTVSGVYTVALTVSGPGGTDTLTRPDYVTVYEPHWEVYLPLVLKNSE